MNLQQHIQFGGGSQIFSKFCTPVNSVPRNYKTPIVNTLNNCSKHKFFFSDNTNQCLCYGIEERFFLLFILPPHFFWLLLLSIGLCRWLAPLCCNMATRELLHACGQIWRPAQQVIRAQGKSVVFCCRGKHTEITPVTDGLLLPCA